MLASVLNSPIAVSASLQVVRAFVSLRQMLSSHAEMAHLYATFEYSLNRRAEAYLGSGKLLESTSTPPSSTSR
jgi:hypothetical protein